MILPALQDEAFLADVAAARQLPHQLHVWWLGQSGFLVQWKGRHLLLDPYLSDSLTAKYAQTDKPHVRMTARVIAPEQLAFVDVVTSSHQHTDHLDAETLVPILHANPAVALVIPETHRALATERLQLPEHTPIGLDAGQHRAFGHFTLHAVPAAHETVERDDHGRCRFLGYVIECGPWNLYHSGDTIRFEGMVEILSRWRIDLAMLPINGRAPERRVAGNLSGPEAAQLAHDLHAGLVIPCHFEMFTFNTASPAAFIDTCHALQQPCAVLRAGQRLSLPPPATG